MNTPELAAMGMCLYVKRSWFFASLNGTTVYAAPDVDALLDYGYLVDHGYMDLVLLGSEDAARVLHRFETIELSLLAFELSPEYPASFSRWYRLCRALGELAWPPDTLVALR